MCTVTYKLYPFLPAQGLLLNVDIVSQFDPAVVQELSELVEDCEACSARINEKIKKSYQCLQFDQSCDQSCADEGHSDVINQS